jgi:hypothetical protein
MPKKLNLNDNLVVAYALENSVAAAAEHFGCSASYVYKRTKAFKDSVDATDWTYPLSTLLISMTQDEEEAFKKELEESETVKLLKEAESPTPYSDDSFDDCLNTIKALDSKKKLILDVGKLLTNEFNSLVQVQLELEVKMRDICKADALKFPIGELITDAMIKEHVTKTINKARESK